MFIDCTREQLECQVCWVIMQVYSRSIGTLFWMSVSRNNFLIDKFCVLCEAKSIFSRIIQVTFSFWMYKIWSLVCRRLHLVKKHKSFNYCHITTVSDILLTISNRRILKCFPLNCSTTVFKENNIDIVEVLKFCVRDMCCDA
jgi:uncharacterized membrane protein